MGKIARWAAGCAIGYALFGPFGAFIGPAVAEALHRAVTRGEWGG